MRMSTLLEEVRKFSVDEGFSPKEIKMAIGIASDPRYKGGNMTGAVRAIDKIKRGLSGHKQVMAVLKRQNEDIEEAMSAKEKVTQNIADQMKEILASNDLLHDKFYQYNATEIETQKNEVLKLTNEFNDNSNM